MKKLIIILLLFINTGAICQTSEDYFKNASALHEQEKNSKALNEINRAIALDTVNLKYLNYKARILVDLAKYEDAFNVYKKAISIDSTYYNTYNERGLLYIGAQQFDEAIADFSTGLEYADNDSAKILLLVNRAAAKMSKRNFKGSYDDLMLVYNIDSNDIGMLINLATICDELGKGSQTFMYLERVIQLDSNNYIAYANIGFKYQLLGEYEKSNKYYNKVLELQPDQALGYSNRSYNKLKLGDLKGAHADIDKSIKLYPGNSYAYRNRALIYIEEKKIEKACDDLKVALKYGFTDMYGSEVIWLHEKYCK
jgi:tetratricopeptide (TPR) repeat protein